MGEYPDESKGVEMNERERFNKAVEVNRQIGAYANRMKYMEVSGDGSKEEREDLMERILELEEKFRRLMNGDL